MHTPEQTHPNIKGCSCTILGLRSLRDTIRLCPLHAAAPKLLEALEQLRELLPSFGPMDGTVWILIDDAIRQAKGE